MDISWPSCVNKEDDKLRENLTRAHDNIVASHNYVKYWNELFKLIRKSKTNHYRCLLGRYGGDSQKKN